MAPLLDLLFVAVVLYAVLHFFVPRHPRVQLTRGRLYLRPSLRQLLGDLTLPIFALLALGMLVLVLVFGGRLVGALVAGVIWCGLGLRVWFQLQRAAVVFDRTADTIRSGRLTIGRTSQATGVRVTGERRSALEVFLRGQDGSTTDWTVPGVDQQYAPSVARDIATYLGVSVITRVPQA